MKLEEIGFYTLSDDRATRATHKTRLERCEVLVTDACNFKCGYCRSNNICGNTKTDNIRETLAYWFKHNLRNIRFSGGEPTLHPDLADLVKEAKANGCERVAISTNGSKSLETYDKLLLAGVDDFSISLDACDAVKGDEMAGVNGIWEKVIKSIQYLSARAYTTVGMVFNEHNIHQASETIRFADSLGVSDIRILSSAQYNRALDNLSGIDDLLAKYPILRYRVNRFRQGKQVRGINDSDSNRCRLVLDDMAVMRGKHYPCIIYLREQGEPIGDMNDDFRIARYKWSKRTDTHKDPICRRNCLDVCVDYNNKAEK